MNQPLTKMAQDKVWGGGGCRQMVSKAYVPQETLGEESTSSDRPIQSALPEPRPGSLMQEN